MTAFWRKDLHGYVLRDSNGDALAAVYRRGKRWFFDVKDARVCQQQGRLAPSDAKKSAEAVLDIAAAAKRRLEASVSEGRES